MRVAQILSSRTEAASQSRHLLYLSDGLRQIGHEVLVLASDDSLEEMFCDHGFEFRELLSSRAMKRWNEIQRHTIEWKAEILHSHSPEMAEMCFMTRLPTIISHHGGDPRIYQRTALARELSHVIALSETDRLRLMKQGGLRPEQVPVLPEPISFDDYARWVHKRQFDANLPPSDGITLLYVPYHGTEEELTRVLEASHLVAQRGQTHRLWILGQSPSGQAQRKRINREIGYPLLDILDEALYPAILPQIDGVLGMGRTMLEGLANDKPVICLQEGELGGVISIGKTFGWEYNRFADTHLRSVQALAEDISKVLKHRWAFVRYVEQVRDLMSQLVDVRHVATRTTAVYRSCLAAHSSKGILHRAYRLARLAIR